MFLHFLLVQSIFLMQSEPWQHDRTKGFPNHAALQDPKVFDLNSTAARRYLQSLVKWAGWVSPLEKFEYGAMEQKLSVDEIIARRRQEFSYDIVKKTRRVVPRTSEIEAARRRRRARAEEIKRVLEERESRRRNKSSHPTGESNNLRLGSHPTGDWLRLINHSLPELVHCEGARCQKRCEDWRLAVLVRDPRDVLTSQFQTERGSIEHFDFDKKECGVWLGPAQKAKCETYSVKQQLRNIIEFYRAAYFIERFTSFRQMGLAPSVVRQKISRLQSQMRQDASGDMRMPTIEQLESIIPPCLSMQLVRYEDLIASASKDQHPDGLCALTRTLGFLGLCTSNLTAIRHALALTTPSVLIRNVGNMRHGFGAKMISTNGERSHEHLGLRKVTLEQRREMEEMIAQGLPGDLGYH